MGFAMSNADDFRAAFAHLEVNEHFTQAIVTLGDQSSLLFTHRVDLRTLESTGDEARRLLPSIVRFRLNAKHLDIQFADGTRWETRLVKG